MTRGLPDLTDMRYWPAVWLVGTVVTLIIAYWMHQDGKDFEATLFTIASPFPFPPPF